jgi:hypothetical protein
MIDAKSVVEPVGLHLGHEGMSDALKRLDDLAYEIDEENGPVCTRAKHIHARRTSIAHSELSENIRRSVAEQLAQEKQERLEKLKDEWIEQKKSFKITESRRHTESCSLCKKELDAVEISFYKEGQLLEQTLSGKRKSAQARLLTCRRATSQNPSAQRSAAERTRDCVWR